MPRPRTKLVLPELGVEPTAPELKMTGAMGAPGQHTILTGDKPQVRMVPVFHARMVVIRTEGDEKLALKDGLGGAFVKVMPTIRASQRSSVDTKSIRERYMNVGACAVVVAPVIVPDGTQEKASTGPRAVLSAEQHLKAWFVGVKAQKRIVDAAMSEALKTVGEAGL